MARHGTANELLDKPYFVMVLRMEVPKNMGNKILKVVVLRALMVAASSNCRSMANMPTPELTTSSRAARVAAPTAGLVVATESTEGIDMISLLS